MTPRPTPRQARILRAFIERGCLTREAVDRVAGASNGPDEVLRLRRRFGLALPCTRRWKRDRDRLPTMPGTYSLTDADRAAALALVGGAL